MSSERRSDNKLNKSITMPPQSVMKLAIVVVAGLSCLTGIALVQVSYGVVAGSPVFSVLPTSGVMA